MRGSNRGRIRQGGIRRGGPGGMPGNQPVQNSPQLRTFTGKVPFDIIYFDDVFPRVGPQVDDSLLTAALLKRNADITPSPDELQTIQNLVTRVQSILENLILSPGTFDACQVDEVRQVGSFKQGTILAGHKTADFVVILKTLPTKEAVEGLSNAVANELRQTECVRPAITNRGFDLSNVQATVRIFITTIPQNFRKLDPEIHLDAKLMAEHWQVIRHSRWFEENAHNSTIKVLIRIQRDLRQRFHTLLPISTWMFDLLAHYALTNNPSRQPLPINVAFRRTLSLMSAGMYLPLYAGTAMRGHSLTYEEEDMATATAQLLLRILSHGGYKAILGLEPLPVDILTKPSVWNGIVVVPIEKAYTKPLDGIVDKIEEDAEAEDENDESIEEQSM